MIRPFLASTTRISSLTIDNFISEPLPRDQWATGDYVVGDTTDDARMPTLARLCESGVHFTNAWAQPTCSPTRATILTGTYPYQHGVLRPVTRNGELDLDRWTLPRALAGGAAGYDLASIGKWHLSTGEDDPYLAGWPHFAGVISGAIAGGIILGFLEAIGLAVLSQYGDITYLMIFVSLMIFLAIRPQGLMGKPWG